MNVWTRMVWASSSESIQSKARSFSFSHVRLLFCHRVPTHRPRSERRFPDSTPLKLKSMLSEVRGSWDIWNPTLDAGQKVDFYTYKWRLVVHDMLMALDSSNGHSYIMCGRRSTYMDHHRFELSGAILYYAVLSCMNDTGTGDRPSMFKMSCRCSAPCQFRGSALVLMWLLIVTVT